MKGSWRQPLSSKKHEKPVILAGGGIIFSGASLELAAFAEKLQIPVATTLMGKGGFPENHPAFAGHGRNARNAPGEPGPDGS
ncbi:hypothetical protein [Aminivibrio sp.]|uniref:hypothetical protein n=1 Tax=Aminivibrio sp. TaxID=1872489 RepID=UPI003D997BA4